MQDADEYNTENPLLRLWMRYTAMSWSATECSRMVLWCMCNDERILGDVRPFELPGTRTRIFMHSLRLQELQESESVAAALTPFKCMERNLSYSVGLTATATALLEDGTRIDQPVVIGAVPILCGLFFNPDSKRLEHAVPYHKLQQDPNDLRSREFANLNLDFAYVVNGAVYSVPIGMQPSPNVITVRERADIIIAAAKNCFMPHVAHDGSFELFAAHGGPSGRSLGEIHFSIPRFTPKAKKPAADKKVADGSERYNILLVLNALGVTDAAMALRVIACNAVSEVFPALLQPTFSAYTFCTVPEAHARLQRLLTNRSDLPDSADRTLEQETMSLCGRGPMFQDKRVFTIGYMINKLLWGFLVAGSQSARAGAPKFSRMYGVGIRDFQQKHTLCTDHLIAWAANVHLEVNTTGNKTLEQALSECWNTAKFTQDAHQTATKGKYKRINGVPVDPLTMTGFVLPMIIKKRHQQRQQNHLEQKTHQNRTTSHKIETGTLQLLGSTVAQFVSLGGKIKKHAPPHGTLQSRAQCAGSDGVTCHIATCSNKNVGHHYEQALTVRFTPIMDNDTRSRCVETLLQLLPRDCIQPVQRVGPEDGRFFPIFVDYVPMALFVPPTTGRRAEWPLMQWMRAVHSTLVHSRRQGRFPTRSIEFCMDFPAPIYTEELLRFGCGAVPTLHVLTEAGRAERPLLVVNPDTGRPPLFDVLAYDPAAERLVMRETGQPIENFEQLLELQLVDLVAAAEQEQEHVAMNVEDIVPGSTCYMEISPQSWFGVMALMTPYINYAPSTRAIYHSHQNTQGGNAFGVTKLPRAHDVRTGTCTMYAQQRLVSTLVSDEQGWDEVPSTHVAMVSFFTMSGFTEEDAMAFNASTVDRGLLRLLAKMRYMDTIDPELMPNGRSFGLTEVRLRVHRHAMPAGNVKMVKWTPQMHEGVAVEDRDKRSLLKVGCFVRVGEYDEATQHWQVSFTTSSIKRRQMASYAHLHPVTGLPKVGSVLRNVDPIIGMIGKDQQDASLFATKIVYESARVDKVTILPLPGTNRLCVIIDLVQQLDNHGYWYDGSKKGKHMMSGTDTAGMPVQRGDKATGFHGNKGVAAIIVSASMLPYYGFVKPDVVFNPTCIVGRALVGAMQIMMAGNVGAAYGKRMDGTPFARTKPHTRIAEMDIGFHNVPLLQRRVTRLVCGLQVDGPTFWRVLGLVRRCMMDVEDSCHEQAATAEEYKEATAVEHGLAETAETRIRNIMANEEPLDDHRFHMPWHTYNVRLLSTDGMWTSGETGEMIGPITHGLMDVSSLKRLAAEVIRACGEDTARDKETNAPKGKGAQRAGRQEIAAYRMSGASDACQQIIHYSGDATSDYLCPTCHQFNTCRDGARVCCWKCKRELTEKDLRHESKSLLNFYNTFMFPAFATADLK